MFHLNVHKSFRTALNDKDRFRVFTKSVNLTRVNIMHKQIYKYELLLMLTNEASV